MQRALSPFLILCLLIMSFFLNQTAFAATCTEPDAHIVTLQGNAQLKRRDENTWLPAASSSIFCAGDSLTITASSKAVVRYKKHTLVNLDGGSTLTFPEVTENDAPVLELIKGFIYLLIRDPNGLKLDTPFYRAGVQGTEFTANNAYTWVMEGQVNVSNSLGKRMLSQGEAAQITPSANAAPKALIITPVQAVQWAIYYPTLMDSALKQSPPAIISLSQKAITLISENDINAAEKLVFTSTPEFDSSPNIQLARSYVLQGQQKINAAYNAAKKATEYANLSPLAWARRSETALMKGDIHEAVSAAQYAVEISTPSNADYAQTALGFALLANRQSNDALQAFNTAIHHNPINPHPWLGKGLTVIQQGQLETGREYIETAVVLDPLRAIYRSYLGRAYQQENRPIRAKTQFSLAQTLDPKSPIPWLFDAILDRENNNPGSALKKLKHSQTLTPNRAIYRAPSLIYNDIAITQATLSSSYSTLGFDQLGLLIASKAATLSPSEASSHRQLLNSYRHLPDHNNSMDKESWQLLVNSPLSAQNNDLALFPTQIPFNHEISPVNAGYEEYRNLFTQQGTQNNLTATIGSQDTFSESFSTGRLFEKTALNASQLHFHTNGSQPNQSLRFNRVSLTARHQSSDSKQFLVQLSNNRWNSGDLASRVNGITDPDFTQSIDETRLDLSYQTKLSAQQTLITTVSALTSQEDFTDGAPSLTAISDGKTDAYNLEMQHTLSKDSFSLINGAKSLQQDGDIDFLLRPKNGTPDVALPTEPYQEADYQSLYSYLNLRLPSKLDLTLGLNYYHYETTADKSKELLPKLAVNWNPISPFTLRLASFENLQSAHLINSGLEPTSLAGFNHYSDLQNGVITKEQGAGIEIQINPSLATGLEYHHQEIQSLNGDEKPLPENVESSAYLYWLPSEKVSLGASLKHHKFTRYDTQFNQPCSLETLSLPVELNYFATPRLTFQLKATQVKQTVNTIEAILNRECSGNPEIEFEEDFLLLDGELNYSLPKPYGRVSLTGKNLFNKKVRFEDNSFQNQLFSSSPKKAYDSAIYAPERSIFLKYSISF